MTHDSGFVDWTSIAVEVGRVHEYSTLDAEDETVDMVSQLTWKVKKASFVRIGFEGLLPLYRGIRL
jgi:hypothetical protein